MVILKKLDKV